LGKNLYIVESKVLLIHLLREFSLKPTPQTPRELQWDTEVFIGAKKYEIKIVKRDLD